MIINKEEFLEECKKEVVKGLEEGLVEHMKQMKKLISLAFIEQDIDASLSEISEIVREQISFSLKEVLKIIEKIKI